MNGRHLAMRGWLTTNEVMRELARPKVAVPARWLGPLQANDLIAANGG